VADKLVRGRILAANPQPTSAAGRIPTPASPLEAYLRKNLVFLGLSLGFLILAPVLIAIPLTPLRALGTGLLLLVLPGLGPARLVREPNDSIATAPLLTITFSLVVVALAATVIRLLQVQINTLSVTVILASLSLLLLAATVAFELRRPQ
jgi:hypothetical protein